MRRWSVMRMRFACLAALVAVVILGCKDERFVPMELFGSVTHAAQPASGGKPVIGEYAKGVPAVLLTANHAALCEVKVGDAFPAMELPKLEGGNAKLESLAGKKATIVVFWSPEGWMNRVAIADVINDFALKEADGGIALLGVLTGAETSQADAPVKSFKDADGQAFAKVGSGAAPRIFVLDSQRKIAWFDIEYSEATRRELHQAVKALSGK